MPWFQLQKGSVRSSNASMFALGGPMAAACLTALLGLLLVPCSAA